jgi:hypothetical protein
VLELERKKKIKKKEMALELFSPLNSKYQNWVEIKEEIGDFSS